MKSIGIILLALFISLPAFGQFEEIDWDWGETAVEQQFRLWSNDSIRIQNKRLDDALVRLQFFESGAPQLVGEIEQRRQIDSLLTIHPTTKEILSVELDSVFKDYLSGAYLEYYENGALKAKGQMEKSGKVGQWVEYWSNSNVKVEVNYLEDGRRQGTYTEYHQNGQLKVSGQFGEQLVIEKHTCFNPETFTEYDCSAEVLIEVKVGEWTAYDQSGKLIKRSTLGPSNNKGK